MKQEYHRDKLALPGPDQPVDFESEQIKLDIPLDGITLEEGWKITPLTAPVVSAYLVSMVTLVFPPQVHDHFLECRVGGCVSM